MYVIKCVIISLLSISVASSASFDEALAREIYDYARPTYCAAEVLELWQCEACLNHPQF